MDVQITINTILCIVMLIVPGIVFKRFYFMGKFSSQFGAGLFADRIIASVFIGIFIQLATLSIFSKWLNLSYSDIKKPITNYYSQLINNNIPDFTSDNITYGLIYISFSIILAISIGSVLHGLVRILKLDVKFSILRFSNNWYYYFSGDILSSTEFKSKNSGKVLNTQVDVLYDNPNGKTTLYSGLLSDFTSTKTGALDCIYLTSSKRYSESEKEFKIIPGDILVLTNDKIINLNIRYITKVKKEQISNLKQLFEPIFFLTLFLLIIIGPWFLNNNLSIYRTIVAIIVSLFIWALGIALLDSYQSPKPTLKGQARRLAIKILIVAIVVDLILFKVVSLWELTEKIIDKAL